MRILQCVPNFSEGRDPRFRDELALVLQGETWGLVEVYRAEGRPFTGEDARAAQDLLERAF